MSLEIIRRIMESPGCAKGAAWALLVSMANHASDDGTGVYASVKTLAKECGIGERTAWDVLPSLLKSGLVTRAGEKHHWGYGHYTQVYGIDLAKLTECGSRRVREPQSAQSAECGKRSSQSAAAADKPVLNPVQIDRGIDGEETESQVAAQPETGSQPRLVPVPYISANSLTPREPETEKLVGMFLNYQGNPGYNEKNTLRYWHSVLSRLLKAYPSLADYMRFGFEADPFWSSGKLIRGKNSKGKDGKKYPDPLDYFEDMLEHIVTNFNRQERGKAASKARKAAAPAKALPAQDHAEPLKARDELLDLACAQDENGPTLVPVREYVRAHEEEYRKNPGLYEEIKWRQWL